MASRGGIRSRPLTKTIFVKIGDGPETSPPDLVYSIKNALLNSQWDGLLPAAKPRRSMDDNW